MSFRRSSTRVKPPKATIKILCVGDGSIGEFFKWFLFLSFILFVGKTCLLTVFATSKRRRKIMSLFLI